MSTRCRYKTGRCTNARVIKPNGTLLLLCEFHRSQQNRTKKRSDMKYRHDRAQRRQLEKRRSPKRELDLRFSLGAERYHRHTTRPSLPMRPTSLQMSTTPTVRSEVLRKTNLLSRLSSGVRQALSGSSISPGKAGSSALRLHPLPLAFPASRDIVAMASPVTKIPIPRIESPSVAHHETAIRRSPQNTTSGPPKPLSRSLHLSLLRDSTPPVCLSAASSTTRRAAPQLISPSRCSDLPCPSPLRSSSAWAARVWQPEDVRILEYFIF
ncbi:hypothetical protein PINS_up019795 [Pythium insidiosum]|nr:hypothetical protein PINS_up005859 [Pythium insidiosum]GLE08548.1 hypothetical protein PINS_up019795 [Pythium insidiosum]